MAEIVYAAGMPHAPTLVGLFSRAPADVQKVVRDSYDGLVSDLETARPDDLVGLAVQCRYLEHSLSGGPSEIQIALSGWITSALGRLAGLEYIALTTLC